MFAQQLALLALSLAASATALALPATPYGRPAKAPADAKMVSLSGMADDQSIDPNRYGFIVAQPSHAGRQM